MIKKKGLRRHVRQGGQSSKSEEPAAVLFIRRTPRGSLVSLIRKE